MGKRHASHARADGLSVKVVFFTRVGFESNELFLYMYARVASQFPECSIVAVRPRSGGPGFLGRVQRYIKKIRRLGLGQTVDIVSSYPLQMYFSRSNSRTTDALLRGLQRPHVAIAPASVKWVSTVNGPDAIDMIRGLRPDVLIQAGAGILRTSILGLPRIACLNLHHGIAPLIRGMNSIHWGLWEKRPEWIGSTVHVMNEGIDAGNVLAYAPVRQKDAGEGFSSLFARATEQGVDNLLEVLSRLDAGERWAVPTPPGEGVYRSTMSGWKLAALALRLNIQRRFSLGETQPRTTR